MNARAIQTLHSVRLLRVAGAYTRPRKRIPKQRWPKLVELEYAKALVSQLGSARAALSELFARLTTLVDKARDARKVDRRDSIDVVIKVVQLLPERYLVDHVIMEYLRYDAGESDELARIMQRVRERLSQAVDPVSVKELAQKFAERTQSVQRVALGEQVKAALGADVFASDKRIPDIRDQFIGENVSLITSIPAQVVNEVEAIVSRAFTNATPHDELTKQINERFNVGESRARLIARDQIGKLYGQTNAYRQQDLGITSFIWRTSGDERVRDEHAALEGEEFPYPEGAPGEGIPGEPIQCRCSAEPVFGDLLNASAASAVDEAPSESAPVPETQRPQAPNTSSVAPAPTHEERAIGRPQEIQQAQQRAARQRAEQESARVVAETARAAHEQALRDTHAANKAVNDLIAQHHAELMQAHEGFRIGVSEIQGTNELQTAPVTPITGHVALPIPVTVPSFRLPTADLPAPVSANTTVIVPAPTGFTGEIHDNETLFRHNISGRAYTAEQLADKQAGKGVILHSGANESPAGFETIETAKNGDRYRSHVTGNTYSLEEIASGYAAETDKLLIDHENARANSAKPGLLNRLARAILRR